VRGKTFFVKYGHRQLPFKVPSGAAVRVLKPPTIKVRAGPTQLFEDALSHPVGALSFDEFFERGDRVAIIVPDITRYAAAQIYLPHLVQSFKRLGIPEEDLTVFFSLGIHRPLQPHEQREIVGEKVFKSIRLVNHDAFNPKEWVSLGRTRRGTPLEVNRAVLEADKILVTGTISFHYFAGFGGGRKGLMPGVASFEACSSNHLLVLNTSGKGKHPLAKTAVLDGNPVHEDINEVCEKVEHVYLFNTILSDDKKILKVVCGNIQGAFTEGCDYLLKNFAIPIGEKADLVVASCGGFPGDINFIQAHKAMDYSMEALRDGGVLILLAECSEGYGNPTFHDWFKYRRLDEFEGALRKRYEINGQTAYSALIKAQRAKVILVSALPKEEVEAMQMQPASSLYEALAVAQSYVGRNALTYVVSEGRTFLPVLGS
jgi:nickel-dependent lactate racemase